MRHSEPALLFLGESESSCRSMLLGINVIWDHKVEPHNLNMWEASSWSAKQVAYLKESTCL